MNEIEKLLNGVKKLERIVGATLGPRGQNVLIDRGGYPFITNDGVTIAREVTFDCQYENLGAKVMLQSSSQTNANAGDGTTSSIVLGAKILEHGINAVKSGQNPVLLKDELLSLVPRITKIITDVATPLTSDKIEAIAGGSSGSEQIGKLVADAFEFVGTDGVVILGENTHGQTTLAHTDGAEFPLSLATPLMVENPSLLNTVYENPRLAIHDGPIKNLNDLRPLLELALLNKFPLIIIADDFSPEILQAILLNRVRNNLPILTLKLADNQSNRLANLQDLAALTSSILISQSNDLTLPTIQLDHLGKCNKIEAGINTTTIHLQEKGVKTQERIDIIKSQLDSETDDYQKFVLRKRLARLTSGIAIISVGAITDIELGETKLRTEDAIAAVKTAGTHGYVVGGGNTYQYVADILDHEILSPALRAIPQRIMENADFKNPEQNPEKTLIPPPKNPKTLNAFGFNAKTLKFCNLLDENIIDPAGVLIQVIQNAISAAATLLTTVFVITNKSLDTKTSP